MTSTITIRQEKDDYILRMIDTGVTNGAMLEKALRKKFGNNVSARFRSEVAGLLKRGEITREGIGDTAEYALASGGRTKTKKSVVSKPVAKATSAAKPSAVPKVEVEKFSASDLKDLGAMLTYLARNGSRPVEQVLRKTFPNGWSMDEVATMVLGTKRNLMVVTDEGLRITKEGYACLDAVLAGEKYE